MHPDMSILRAVRDCCTPCVDSRRYQLLLDAARWRWTRSVHLLQSACLLVSDPIACFPKVSTTKVCQFILYATQARFRVVLGPPLFFVVFAGLGSS